MDRLMAILDEELLLDLRKGDVVNNSNRLVRPFAVERFLESGERDMLRFDLTTARPRGRRCNKAAYLLRPLCEPFYTFGGADDSEARLGRTFLCIARSEQKQTVPRVFDLLVIREFEFG